MRNQFAPIQTSPTMAWTKYPSFQVPDDPPLAVNRPRAAAPVPGCSGMPDIRKMPAIELAKSIRALRRPSSMGATGVQMASPTMTVPQAIAQVTGGILHLLINGVAGYYIGKWAGASKGWTAAGTAVLGPLGTLASVGFTGSKKCATPNCSCKPNRRKRRVRSASQQWDQLWENYIAARRSGNKKRILDTAELLETFDRSKGWKPTVTVSSVRREFGW